MTRAMAPFVNEKLNAAIRSFNDRGQVRPDPLAARYAERRAGYSLFARMMSDAEIEALRPYIFCYGELPARRKLTIRNFIAGGMAGARVGRARHHDLPGGQAGAALRRAGVRKAGRGGGGRVRR